MVAGRADGPGERGRVRGAGDGRRAVLHRHVDGFDAVDGLERLADPRLALAARHALDGERLRRRRAAAARGVARRHVPGEDAHAGGQPPARPEPRRRRGEAADQRRHLRRDGRPREEEALPGALPAHAFGAAAAEGHQRRRLRAPRRRPRPLRGEAVREREARPAAAVRRLRGAPELRRRRRLRQGRGLREARGAPRGHRGRGALRPPLLPQRAADGLRRRRAARVRALPRALRLHAAHHREALRPRRGVLRGAGRADERLLRRERALPHRPLPGQGGRAESVQPALREPALRAHVERGKRRVRGDHVQGGHRHHGPRRLLRRLRHHPRHHAEPPAPGLRALRDGAARVEGARGRPGRQGRAPREGRRARRQGRVPRPVHGGRVLRGGGLPRRPGRARRLGDADVRGRRAPRRQRPLARRALPHEGGQGPRRAPRGGARALQSPALQRAPRRQQVRAQRARLPHPARRGALPKDAHEEAGPHARVRADVHGHALLERVRARVPRRRVRAHVPQRGQGRLVALRVRAGAGRGLAHLHAAAARHRRPAAAARALPLWGAEPGGLPRVVARQGGREAAAVVHGAPGDARGRRRLAPRVLRPPRRGQGRRAEQGRGPRPRARPLRRPRLPGQVPPQVPPGRARLRAQGAHHVQGLLLLRPLRQGRLRRQAPLLPAPDLLREVSVEAKARRGRRGRRRRAR
mmetsp:Transcript_21695/g.71768  ORF Transcript_21695/g.71768 Transcript_21695/m.71768 type:complete len:696 (+) Transcript_21695:2014-4101(+)